MSQVSRREFLKILGAGAASALLPKPSFASGEAGPPPETRPNIGFVFSVEHRWQSLPFTETPGLRTPFLSRLAAEGASLDNMISNYPLCSPYRAMLLTGEWPTQNGVTKNNAELSPDRIALGRALQSAGYETGYVGKWHLGSVRSVKPYGFDRSRLWENSPDHWSRTHYDDDGNPVADRGYVPSRVTDAALEFIGARRARPFFLAVSWDAPHMDFNDAPEEFRSLYLKAGREFFRKNMDFSRDMRADGFGNRWDIRANYLGYHAHVSAIDAELGRILGKLDDLQLARDTVVIYTSDHGSMLWSHGLMGKGLPYAEAVKVPFLVRWPGKIAAGKRVARMAGAIDLMPTLCALAGAAQPGHCQGESFMGALVGEGGRGPESQILMNLTNDNALAEFLGVQTDRYTYASFVDGRVLLFDNREDPYQNSNRAEDPAVRLLRKDLRAMLNSWLQPDGRRLFPE